MKSCHIPDISWDSSKYVKYGLLKLVVWGNLHVDIRPVRGGCICIHNAACIIVPGPG